MLVDKTATKFQKVTENVLPCHLRQVKNIAIDVYTTQLKKTLYNNILFEILKDLVEKTQLF